MDLLVTYYFISEILQSKRSLHCRNPYKIIVQQVLPLDQLRSQTQNWRRVNHTSMDIIAALLFCATCLEISVSGKLFERSQSLNLTGNGQPAPTLAYCAVLCQAEEFMRPGRVPTATGNLHYVANPGASVPRERRS